MAAFRTWLVLLPSILWVFAAQVGWGGALVVELHLPSNNAKKHTPKMRYENSVAIPRNPVDSGTFYQLQTITKKPTTAVAKAKTTTISPLRVEEIPAAVHQEHRAREAMKVVSMLADAVEMAKDSLIAKAGQVSKFRSTTPSPTLPPTNKAFDSYESIVEASTHLPAALGYAHHYRAPWVNDVQRRLSDSNKPGIRIRQRPLADDRRAIIPKRKFRPPAGTEPSSGFVVGGSHGKSGGTYGHHGQGAARVEIEMHGSAPVQLEIGKQGAISVHTDKVVLPISDNAAQPSKQHKAIGRSLEGLPKAEFQSEPWNERRLRMFKYAQSASVVQPKQRRQRASPDTGSPVSTNGTSTAGQENHNGTSANQQQKPQPVAALQSQAVPDAVKLQKESLEKGSTTQLLQPKSAPLPAIQQTVQNSHTAGAMLSNPLQVRKAHHQLQQQTSPPANIPNDKMHLLPFFAQMNIIDRRNNKQSPISSPLGKNHSMTGLTLMSAPITPSPRPQPPLALTFVKAVTAPAAQTGAVVSKLPVPDVGNAPKPGDKARFYRSVWKRRMKATRLRHGDIFLLVKRMKNKINKRSSSEAKNNSTEDANKKRESENQEISSTTKPQTTNKTTANTATKTTRTTKPVAEMTSTSTPKAATEKKVEITTTKRTVPTGVTAEKRVTKQVVTKATTTKSTTKKPAPSSTKAANRTITTLKRAAVTTHSTARVTTATAAGSTEGKVTETNRMIDAEATESSDKGQQAPERATSTESPTTKAKSTVKKTTTKAAPKTEAKRSETASNNSEETEKLPGPESKSSVEELPATDPPSTVAETEALTERTTQPTEPTTAPPTTVNKTTRKATTKRTTVKTTTAAPEELTPEPPTTKKPSLLENLAPKGGPPRQKPKLLMKQLDKIADKIADKLVARRVWDKSSVKGVLSKSMFEGLTQQGNPKPKPPPRKEFDEIEDSDLSKRKGEAAKTQEKSLRELVDDWYPKFDTDTAEQSAAKRRIVHKSSKEVLDEEGDQQDASNVPSEFEPQESNLKKKAHTGDSDMQGEEEAEMELPPSKRGENLLFIRPATKLAIPEQPMTKRRLARTTTLPVIGNEADVPFVEEKVGSYHKVNQWRHKTGDVISSNGGFGEMDIMPKSVTVMLEQPAASGNSGKWNELDNNHDKGVVTEAIQLVTQPVPSAVPILGSSETEQAEPLPQLTGMPSQQNSTKPRRSKSKKHRKKGTEEKFDREGESLASSEAIHFIDEGPHGEQTIDQQSVVWHTMSADPRTRWVDVEDEAQSKIGRLLNRRSLLDNLSVANMPRHHIRAFRRMMHSAPT